MERLEPFGRDITEVRNELMADRLQSGERDILAVGRQ